MALLSRTCAAIAQLPNIGAACWDARKNAVNDLEAKTIGVPWRACLSPCTDLVRCQVVCHPSVYRDALPPPHAARC